MTPERRTDLRKTLGTSLDRWLASVARKTGAHRVVVADSSGLLVAADSSGTDAERLAAQVCAPNDISRPVPIDFRRVTVWGEDLHLCASGDPQPRRAALELAAPGVVRIFTGGTPE